MILEVFKYQSAIIGRMGIVDSNNIRKITKESRFDD